MRYCYCSVEHGEAYIGSPQELIAVRFWASEVHLCQRSDVVSKAASFEGTSVNDGEE